MRYDLPQGIKKKKKTDWPSGVGGIPVLLSDGSRTEMPVLKGVNSITFGVTGTGKTRSYTLPAAEVLLNTVPGMKGVFFYIKNAFIDRLIKPDDKVIAYDPNQVFDGSRFHWCLIKEIRQAKDREAEMRQIADFLFSDILTDANQNLAWAESARNTFVAVLRVLVDCFAVNTTNRTLVRALRKMTLAELLDYLAKHPRNRSLLEKDFSYSVEKPSAYKRTRRAEDIMFFFNQVLEKFAGTFESDGSDTIHDFLHSGSRNLFILYDLASAEISRPFILYFLKKIKDEKMSNTSDVKSPVLFCLDEVDKLADGGRPADFGLFQAATLGRECGLQILLTTQSMENLYGLAPDFNSHVTEGGMAGFSVILSFRPGDSATVRNLQTLFGSGYREHLVLPASRYDHTSIKYERESVVSDEDFAGLGTGECYVKIGSCQPQKVKFL